MQYSLIYFMYAFDTCQYKTINDGGISPLTKELAKIEHMEWYEQNNCNKKNEIT